MVFSVQNDVLLLLLGVLVVVCKMIANMAEISCLQKFPVLYGIPEESPKPANSTTKLCALQDCSDYLLVNILL